MVKHVVMWKLRENNIRNRSMIRNMLNGLKDHIEALNSLETGDNLNQSEFAYDLVLITTHVNKESLEKYKEHPEHVAVAARIKEMTTDRAVVDFEY